MPENMNRLTCQMTRFQFVAMFLLNTICYIILMRNVISTTLLRRILSEQKSNFNDEFELKLVIIYHLEFIVKIS